MPHRVQDVEVPLSPRGIFGQRRSHTPGREAGVESIHIVNEDDCAPPPQRLARRRGAEPLIQLKIHVQAVVVSGHRRAHGEGDKGRRLKRADEPQLLVKGA
eukprot:scaffold1091_cov125-Isochrysis_galbana.AAC.6